MKVSLNTTAFIKGYLRAHRFQETVRKPGSEVTRNHCQMDCHRIGPVRPHFYCPARHQNHSSSYSHETTFVIVGSPCSFLLHITNFWFDVCNECELVVEPRSVSCSDAGGSGKVWGIFNFDSERQALPYKIGGYIDVECWVFKKWQIFTICMNGHLK